ncbi:MAG: NRDE family protein [Gammaproteobacteria bacterium]|nr:NRDE family protein [Gammaproteobacteria bacterium]
MRLILFAQGVHPDWPLLLAANRDEFHRRPTAAAGFWAQHPDVLAGIDLEAGGTWMGIRRDGRIAAVTNYAEPPPEPMPPRSRGDLVADYLIGDRPAAEYLATLEPVADQFRGFNLLLGTPGQLWSFSNRDGGAHRLAPGTYGLSNHLLDTAWPRVNRGKSALADFERAEAAPDVDDLLALLGDEDEPRDEELESLPPDACGPGATAPCFIRGDVYGTRSSTVLMVHRSGRVRFTEQRFGPDGIRGERSDFEFELEPPLQ